MLASATLFRNINAGSPSSPIVLYLSTVSSTTSGTSFTFTSVSIGAADSNRKVFAEVGTSSGTNIVSVTIGGVSAVNHVDVGTTNKASIWVADVPTGTSATVVVTTQATASGCVVSLYSSTVAEIALLDTSTASQGTGNPGSLNLSDLAVRPNGFALVIAGASTTTGTTETYNGADPLVVNDEQTAGLRFSSCSVRTTESVDTNDFTFATAGTSGFTIVGASYFPLTGSVYGPSLASTFSDGTNATTYTFNGQGVGVANASRQILICFAWGSASGRTPTSVTVNGNAADQVALASAFATGCAIYSYSLPAGTTADIVITMSSTCQRMVGGVYDTRPRGLLTAVDSGSNNQTTASITVADIEVRPGGYLVSVGIQPITETMTPAYNGADTLVLDSQITIESATSVALMSCQTTEFAKTNDPGFSTPTSNAKSVCAASFL